MEEFRATIEQLFLDGGLDLKPTQNKISLPIAFRIHKKMKANLKFDAIKICDDLLIDGHHRYIASIIAGAKIEHFPTSKNQTQISFDWKDVSLSTTDYDNPNEIKYYNFNDALRNDMTVDQIEEILNT